jgi:hypothetical protein
MFGIVFFAFTGTPRCNNDFRIAKGVTGTPRCNIDFRIAKGVERSK